MDNNNDVTDAKRVLIEDLSNHINDLGYFLKKRSIKSFVRSHYKQNHLLPSKEESLRVLLTSKYLKKLRVIGCTGKVGHKNKKEANEAKSIMEKRYSMDFFIYKCQGCKCYHLTRKPQK